MVQKDEHSHISCGLGCLTKDPDKMPVEYYKYQIVLFNSADLRLYHNVDENIVNVLAPHYSDCLKHLKKKEDEDKKNNLLLYIIIGGAGLIVIVGILIVIIMCARRRKSEESLTTEE